MFRSGYLILLLAVVLILVACGERPVEVDAAADPAPVAIVYDEARWRRPPLTTTSTTAVPTTTTTAPRPRPKPSSPTTTASGDGCGGWASTLAAHFPPEQIGQGCRVMMCESRGNPLADNPRSSASGLFQALDSTWAGWGGYQRALHAPPGVQVEHAAALWRSRGWQPWAACA